MAVLSAIGALAQAGTGVNAWNEFVIGLLDAGELLIDDISVVEEPDGAAVELIQNGSFASDTVGTEADTWRIIGSHSGTVVARSGGSLAIKVLHLVATSATKDTHNHGETTLVGNTVVQLGTEYEVSYARQMDSRFQPTQFATVLQQARRDGPVADSRIKRNSRRGKLASVESNIGPTFADVHHGPIVPTSGQSVTVGARIEDA